MPVRGDLCRKDDERQRGWTCAHPLWARHGRWSGDRAVRTPQRNSPHHSGQSSCSLERCFCYGSTLPPTRPELPFIFYELAGFSRRTATIPRVGCTHSHLKLKSKARMPATEARVCNREISEPRECTGYGSPGKKPEPSRHG